MTLGIVDAADGMGGTFGDSGAHKVNFSGIDRFIFTGGAGNDHIITSTGDDVMSGGEGDDQFDANGGNDSLTGGVGNDILRGGDGNDILVGGVGNDTLNGGAGVDTMTGGTGDDLYVIDSLGDVATELEGEGSDRISTSLATYVLGSTFEELAGSSAAGQTLTGNAGDNLVSGWTGDDILRLNDGGADRAVGGAGSDTIYFGATFGAGDSADGGSDYDVLLLRGSYSGLSLGANVAGIESLELMSHSDSRFGGATAGPNSYAIVSQGLSGTAGLFQVDGTKLEAGETLSFDGSAETSIAFALLGGAANDVLKGGAMGDTLDGGAGADTMTGGGGDDFYRVDNANDVVVEQAHGGADRVRTTLAAYTLGANVEGLIGGLDTGQVLTGNALDNSIVGGAGNDVLDGAGGASDYLEGNGGDDRFQISLAGNVGAYGGSGTDTLVVDYSAAGGSVTSFLDTNADGHFGGLHDDAGRSVSFGGIDKFDVTTGSFDDDLRTGDGDDRLVLGAGNDLGDAGGGNDQVEGGAGNDTLLGGAGDDRLDGGAGADSMYGGQGNDLYLADSSDQAFENAGEGVDEVRTGATTYILGANFEKLTATGYGAAPLSLRGNALDNVITTEVGGAVVYLQDGGADAAYGATNNDVFYFGAAFGAGDRVDGALGSDTVVLQGAYGPLTLTAGTMIGIQTLALLSAGDDRFGGATAGTFSYDIIVAADFSSAIPMPGLPFIDEQGALVVDASGLAVGESLHFDASAADPAATYWSVRGGAGADHLVGGAGGDDLRGGGGDDLLEGGAGNDYLDDSGGGSNVLRGGEGDDLVNFDSEGSATWSTLVVEGGDGDDWALFYAGSAGTATIDMGAGDDRVDIRHMAGGSARLTLGGGRDTLAMAAVPILDAGGGLGAITVADFQAGAGGDRFEWPADLTAIFAGWTPGINPFEAGYARLVQSGADTLLQVSPSANGTFATLLRFENLAPADFTGDNLGGWSPLPVTGGAGADQLVGTASSDFLFGEGGNDFLFLQHGGDDSAHGGDGNDVLYFGEAFTSLDRADGGEGRDAIVLQGDYALTLSETNIAGIESISLQSGANTKFGDTANNFYDFAITMADGNVLPGQQLIVNGQSLRAGEDFTFNGSAEHDGKFLVYGGHGVDHLTGGDGVDVFFFEGQRWGADNKVDGGAGRDAVVISAGDGVTHIEFAADALVNIESISVNNHFATDPSQHPSYELVLNNGNVTAGGTLIVNGSSLATSAQYVNVDGSGVHDGNLILFGGAGNDALIGGDGADTLFGAGGADNLTGGAGADVFRYDATSDSTTGAVDDISGFQAGVDKIDLSRIDADTLTAGDQAFSWIGDAAFSHVAGELRFYESGGYGWVEGDTNGDGSADFVIALTAPPALLAQGDFLL
jgi:Ca2+-binding RTX toxin-like protein